MTTEQFLEEFKLITQEMYATARKKNHDYTGNVDDPFKNFTMVELMGAATTEQGFFTRMTDKIMRIGGFIRSNKLLVLDEKIEDTLLDLAVYAILFVIYLRSKE